MECCELNGIVTRDSSLLDFCFNVVLNKSNYVMFLNSHVLYLFTKAKESITLNISDELIFEEIRVICLVGGKVLENVQVDCCIPFGLGSHCSSHDRKWQDRLEQD